jgi:hypothetical protein
LYDTPPYEEKTPHELIKKDPGKLFAGSSMSRQNNIL